MELSILQQNAITAPPAINSVWQQFAQQLPTPSSQDHYLDSWTANTLPELHEKLNAEDHYQQNLLTAKNEPFHQYSLTLPLFKNTLLSANLVTIEKGRYLPLHDHPNSGGFMLVIEGNVNVLHCELDATATDTQTRLNILQTDVLQETETNWFTATKRNIHRIESNSERSVLLVIQTPALIKKQQSFYFPLQNNVYPGKCVQVQRVRAYVLDNISKRHSSSSNNNL